ncbi:DHA2 family efflux MFS transporter permease subunit [Micromonospora sp. DT228]|uniref:DHA2 family efflux MFS transporter permease subunit n=1 Tax=Micromonospora sp. DT228 TaxID=3393443 RepID=UPI003CEC6D21
MPDEGAVVGKSTSLPLLLACGAAFLALLDVTVVNLAIPDLITSYPGVTVADASWVITIYATVFAALLAPAGRIADVIGRRALFMTGVGVFTAMSLLDALAPNLAVLLVGRGLQAVGAAAMIPASLAIVLHDTSAARRGAAIGAWSAAGALAAALGPALGGILVDAFGWRSVFVINLPLGVLIVLGAVVLPAGRSAGGRLPDLIGTTLLAGAVGLAVLGVTEGGDWGWGDLRTIACLAGAVAAGALTVWRSLRHPVPTIEIALWRNRGLAVANLASLLYGGALFAWMLCSVLYLTEIWHYRELQAGLAMSPTAVLTAVVALLTGRFIHRLGLRAAVILGALVMAAGAGLFALWAPGTPHFASFFLPAAAIGAVGIGVITTGVSTAAALSVQPQRFAAATGLNQTARQIGGALGIAILAAVLAGQAATDLTAYRDVFGFCALLAVLAGVVGVFLVTPSRPQPAPAQPVSKTAV